MVDVINCTLSYVVSPIFNDHWKVALIRWPFEDTGDIDPEEVLEQEMLGYVGIVLLPLGVYGMEYDLKIKHKKSMDDWEILQVKNKMGQISVGYTDLNVKDIIDDESLTIIVQIKITKCFDDDQKEIIRANWSKYGIID